MSDFFRGREHVEKKEARRGWAEGTRGADRGGRAGAPRERVDRGREREEEERRGGGGGRERGTGDMERAEEGKGGTREDRCAGGKNATCE